MNSRQKGKRGELELAHYLKDHGYKNARRSVQYNGKAENAKCDVLGLDGYHVECKRVEKLNLEKASEQAERDAENGDIPIVVHKKNRKPWYVTIRLDNFLDIISKTNT